MIDRLDNLSWLTTEFLDKVKMYREFPFTYPNMMKNISGACKVVVGYFQNLVNYKILNLDRILTLEVFQNLHYF